MADDLICWDASALISLIKGYPKRESVLKSVVGLVDGGKYKLVFSTLIYTEVLESSMPEGATNKFKEFMNNRGRFNLFAVDINIAKEAQEIRDKTRIKTPDAIHIATAIVSGSKLFHTFDEKLLQLNGKEEVKNISITPCTVPGTSSPLPFDTSP